MKHLFAFTLRGVLLCCLFTALNSCSENLYNTKDVRPSEFSQPRADEALTLLAITPFNGPNADTLRAIGLDIQETTNYNQPLPMGIDVVYINADAAPEGIGKSKLFWEVLEKGATLVIDGSNQKMETFCTENLHIYTYGAELIAYRMSKNEDDSDQDPEIRPESLDVIDYGPGRNAISQGMLLESLWGKTAAKTQPPLPYPYSKPDNSTAKTPLPVESVSTLFDSPYSSAGSALRVGSNKESADEFSTCISTWCQSHSGLAVDKGPWWGVYDACRDENKKPVVYHLSEHGCHFYQQPLDFTKSYAIDVTQKSSRSQLWYEYSDFLRRQKCWDDKLSQGVTVDWQKISYNSVGNNKRSVFYRQALQRFESSKCKSCYLDFSVINGKTQSWSLDHKGGAGIGLKTAAPFFEVFSVSVDAEFERTLGTSQTVTVTQSTQREFWVTPCMFKVANGKSNIKNAIIYGRVVAETVQSKRAGFMEFNLGIRYIRDNQKQEKKISYCFRQGGNQELINQFSGNVRTSKYYWIYSKWYTRLETPISTFKNCNVK
jgi:hypothetical protein